MNKLTFGLAIALFFAVVLLVNASVRLKASLNEIQELRKNLTTAKEQKSKRASEQKSEEVQQPKNYGPYIVDEEKIRLEKENEQLKNEIAQLKGQKGKSPTVEETPPKVTEGFLQQKFPPVEEKKPPKIKFEFGR